MTTLELKISTFFSVLYIFFWSLSKVHDQKSHVHSVSDKYWGTHKEKIHRWTKTTAIFPAILAEQLFNDFLKPRSLNYETAHSCD